MLPFSDVPGPRRPRRSVHAVLLLAAAALLPGCPAWTATMKGLGIVGSPELVLTDTIPQDFELLVHVTDQAEPAADYLLTFRRTGRCDYRMTARSPRRTTTQDHFDVNEDQIVALYDAVRAADYADLPTRIPDDGMGDRRDLGVHAYSVRANDLAKEVQVHFTEVAGLERIRALALSLLPAKATAQVGTMPVDTGTSAKLVGDVVTKLFYFEGDERLKELPPERIRTFVDWYEAVNENYSPAPGVTGWDRPR